MDSLPEFKANLLKLIKDANDADEAQERVAKMLEIFVFLRENRLWENQAVDSRRWMQFKKAVTRKLPEIMRDPRFSEMSCNVQCEFLDVQSDLGITSQRCQHFLCSKNRFCWNSIPSPSLAPLCFYHMGKQKAFEITSRPFLVSLLGTDPSVLVLSCILVKKRE